MRKRTVVYFLISPYFYEPSILSGKFFSYDMLLSHERNFPSQILGGNDEIS